MNSAAGETDKEFDARIDAEDLEAAQVRCPLDSCRAEIGEMCKTDAGQPRCRHARRLWLVRKEREG
jgi:hypothetical protein